MGKYITGLACRLIIYGSRYEVPGTYLVLRSGRWSSVIRPVYLQRICCLCWSSISFLGLLLFSPAVFYWKVKYESTQIVGKWIKIKSWLSQQASEPIKLVWPSAWRCQHLSLTVARGDWVCQAQEQRVQSSAVLPGDSSGYWRFRR